MGKRRRNPQQFTTDEAQTATLLVTEGTVACHRLRRWYYPRLEIRMCDPDALKPAERVLKRKLGKVTYPRMVCSPETYPDPYTQHRIAIVGHPADETIERLKPLLTPTFVKRYERMKKKCPPKP